MDFKELIAYKKAFKLAMEIYKISKQFPKEEKYSLTDQIRRSFRSTCANIAESYRKRIYPKYFVSKLTDSDGENSETLVWLDFALVSSQSYIFGNVIPRKAIPSGELVSESLYTAGMLK